MASVGRIEWRRGFPSRAWGRLGWYLALSAVAVVIGYVLFGSEPGRLESGRRNPLALVPVGLAVLFGLVAVPRVVALFRRPLVAADHYALSIRPGILRTLLLPWARIAEIAAYGLRDEPFLLVRYGSRQGRLGDRLHWWDRFALRAAIRASRVHRGEGPDVRAYHVAVRMDEFVGEPEAHLASLAAFAPHHVVVTDELY
jgi:hypothetical protein